MSNFDRFQTFPLPGGNSNLELLVRTGAGVSRQAVNFAAYAALAAGAPDRDAAPNPYEQATFGQQLFAGKSVLTSITLTSPAWEEEVQDRRTGAFTVVAHPSQSITLDTVLVDVERQSQIIKTQIMGRPGSVKEYIALDDYALTLRGAIVGAGRAYPTDDVKKLVAISRCPEAITIISDYLQDIHNITSVVVENVSFAQSEGTVNTQLVELQLLSDEPLELQSIKPVQ